MYKCVYMYIYVLQRLALKVSKFMFTVIGSFFGVTMLLGNQSDTAGKLVKHPFK